MNFKYQVRDLIRERAALEKEYAQKLQAIARKAAEKRSRTAAARIVGEDPAKAFGDDAIRRKSVQNATKLASSPTTDADVNTVSHVASDTKARWNRHSLCLSKRMTHLLKTMLVLGRL